MSIHTKYLSFLGGATMLTFGVACIIIAGLGTGSWDGVNVGLGSHLEVAFGTVAVVVGIISAIFAAILRGVKPNFFTIITATLLGYLVNFWLFILQIVPTPTTFWMQAMLLIVGIGIQGIGMALYLLPGLAPNALDDLMLAIKDRFSLSVGKSKLLFDLVGFLLSTIVGGPIGIGTVIVTLAMGPYINFWYTVIGRRIQKIK